MEPQPIKHAIIHESGDVEVPVGILKVKDIKGYLRLGPGESFKAMEGPGGATTYVDPMADQYGRDFNWVATTWMRPMMHPADNIHGPAVVVGPSNDLDGHPGDLTPENLEDINLVVASFSRLESVR